MLLTLQSSPLRAPRDCFSGSYGSLSHTWAFIMSLILKENSEALYKSFIIYIKVLDSKRNTRIIHSIEFSKTGPDSSSKASEPVV